MVMDEGENLRDNARVVVATIFGNEKLHKSYIDECWNIREKTENSC